MLSHFSRVWLFEILWTVAHQAPLSTGSPGKNTGVDGHSLLQGIFQTWGLNEHILSPVLKAESLLLSHRQNPRRVLENFKTHFFKANLCMSSEMSILQVKSWTIKKAECWRLILNCGVGECCWESLGLQGDPTSQYSSKSVLNIHWKDWGWSWSSNTLATWCEEMIH